MNFTKLVPNVFHDDIEQALRLFVDSLEFEIEHDEIESKNPLCIVAKNGLRINLFQNAQLAGEHNPEFRSATDDTEAVYNNILASHPQLLHPNPSQITAQPWAAKECATTDKQLGIVI